MTALMAVILVSALGQKQDELKQSDKIVQRLWQFESDWLTASLNQDKAWLEQFFNGKLIVIPFENDVVKNRARETVEMIDPKLKPEEMKVRITGNIKVLTNGGNRSYYFLDTFNKREGKWQIIATHFSSVPETTSENIEQTIMQMEREWRTLTVKKDIAGLKRIIADNFVGIESSGRIIDKTQTINDVASGDIDVQSDSPEDMKVRIYGDTAVVTGRLSIKGKKKEENYGLQLLFTDTWVKRDGQWQLVNYQTTQIK
jgi:ketosteroid isomerase-like protein